MDADQARMGLKSATVAKVQPSWLCATETDIQRYFDLDGVVRVGRRRIFWAVIFPALITTFGFGAALKIAWGSLIAFGLLLEWLRRSMPATPATGFLSVAGFQLLFTAGVAFSGGLRSPWLPWLAMPVMMLAFRFRQTVTFVSSAVAVATAVVACVVATRIHSAHPFPVVFHGIVVGALLAAICLFALSMQSAEIESRSAANRDPLTGLPNRKALSDTLRRLTDEARSTDQWLCVLTCDLDHFKRINDNHGHQRGDEVLVETAERLRSSLGDDGTIFRVGGEEFVVLLPGADPPTGSRTAERLRRSVSAAPISQLPVTVSVGVTAGFGNEVDPATLLANSDVALYAAKNAGRDTVRLA